MAGRDPQCIPSKHTDTTRLIRFVLKPVSFGANLVGFGGAAVRGAFVPSGYSLRKASAGLANAALTD
jgi:hypothetical protein